MSEPVGIPVKTRRTLNVVSPKLAAKMAEFKARRCTIYAGHSVTAEYDAAQPDSAVDWDPAAPESWGFFPRLPMMRGPICRGVSGKYGYNHHHTIAKLGDTYVATWASGFLHEDFIGQRVRYSTSVDGIDWSEPKMLVHTPVASEVVRNNAGLYSDGERLYAYVGVAWNLDRDRPQAQKRVPRMRLDVYETTDLENWTCHEGIFDDIYLFEGPRMTSGGKLMCSGLDARDHHAMVIMWDDATQLADKPRVVHLESGEGILPGEGTWYQTDDGRIWLYQRDESGSCHLALSCSEDEGKTWSDMLLTDFPNSTSRSMAGRLNDGRFFIMGNNYDLFLNRKHMQIALSDDGLVFDRQYTLIEGETTRRVNGFHKEDGYQYPHCCLDGDKIVVIYSINKEDIEVGTVDMSQVS